MEETSAPNERVLLHARRHGKRWHMLQRMRELEQQGMHFMPVAAHIFYGYWKKEEERRKHSD